MSKKNKPRAISRPKGTWEDWLPSPDNCEERISFDDETVCALCGKQADCRCHYYRCDKCGGYSASCSCHHDVCNDCEDLKYFCVCED